MTAVRSVTLATQTEALTVLQLEMLALQEMIHRDYATKLAAIDQNLAHDQISNRAAILDHEKQIRMNLLARCEDMIKYNEMWMTNTRLRSHDFKSPKPPLPIYMFKSSRPTPAALQQDIELLTTTVRITKKLISDPANIDNTLIELTDHGVKLDTYLNNAVHAAKKKKMWADIILAIGGLLTVTLMIALFPLPILLPLAITFAGLLAFAAASLLVPIATLSVTLALNEAIKPSMYCAESNIEICKQAQTFHSPKR